MGRWASKGIAFSSMAGGLTQIGIDPPGDTPLDFLARKPIVDKFM
jgi:hypothetical protein